MATVARRIGRSDEKVLSILGKSPRKSSWRSTFLANGAVIRHVISSIETHRDTSRHANFAILLLLLFVCQAVGNSRGRFFTGRLKTKCLFPLVPALQIAEWQNALKQKVCRDRCILTHRHFSLQVLSSVYLTSIFYQMIYEDQSNQHSMVAVSSDF